jgi:hypothetical protein
MRAFRPNPDLEKELSEQADYLPGLAETVAPAAEVIAALSPVGDTGDFHDSIEVEIEGEEVRVGTTDPFGHLVEFGSAKNPPYAPIRRGVRAAGLRLEESPKS